jgi:hypothetical protein
VNGAAPLFAEAGIFMAIAVILITALGARATRASVRAHRAQEKQAAAVMAVSGNWQRSYAELLDACDAVIGEVAAHPATYSTFPETILGLLDSAHDHARELERKNTAT